MKLVEGDDDIASRALFDGALLILRILVYQIYIDLIAYSRGRVIKQAFGGIATSVSAEAESLEPASLSSS